MSLTHRLFTFPAAAALTGACVVAGVSPAAAAPASTGAVSSRIAAPAVAVGSPALVRLQQSSARKSSARKQSFAGLGARQIRDRSVTAFKNARSFRVTGNELDKTLGRVTLDFHISAAQAYGRVTSAKGSMDIIRIGNEAWLRYDAKFAKTTASPVDGVGTWFKVSSGSKVWSNLKPATPGAWVKWFSDFRLSSKTKGRTYTGTPTIRLVQPGRKGGSLYVATAGPAYPRFAFRNDKLFTYSFYEYNKPFTVQAPA